MWGWVATSWAESLVITKRAMNFAFYQKILQESLWSSICDLKLKRNWVTHWDIDLKHKGKSTSERLKRNRIKVLEWASQSLELLWWDLKVAIHHWQSSSVAELKNFYKKEPKFPYRYKSCLTVLICTYSAFGFCSRQNNQSEEVKGTSTFFPKSFCKCCKMFYIHLNGNL